jgi:predicted transcriptional regulator
MVIIKPYRFTGGASFLSLKNCIHDLRELELIEDEGSLKLTEKGKQFVGGYEKVLGFIKIMGITYR